MFEREATLVRLALGALNTDNENTENFVTVHHIGSTSVPKIYAKPIIDMLGMVRDIEKIDPRAFDEIGYVFREEGGIPFCRFLYKGDWALRSHHLHIFEAGAPQIQRHLVFRDYLRKNVEEKKCSCGRHDRSRRFFWVTCLAWTILGCAGLLSEDAGGIE